MTNTASTHTQIPGNLIPAWRLVNAGDFFYGPGGLPCRVVSAGAITTRRDGTKVAEVYCVAGPGDDEPVLLVRIPVDQMVEVWT